MANDDNHSAPPAPPPVPQTQTRLEKSPTSRTKKIGYVLVGVIVFTVLGISLFTIMMFTVLSAVFHNPSEEERYQNINNFLEEIDYKTGGPILEESYDGNGPSPLNPAYFNATYQGEEAYETLKPRILEAVGEDCDLIIDPQLRCTQEVPSVYLRIEENGDTHLMLTEEGPGL